MKKKSFMRLELVATTQKLELKTISDGIKIAKIRQMLKAIMSTKYKINLTKILLQA